MVHASIAGFDPSALAVHSSVNELAVHAATRHEVFGLEHIPGLVPSGEDEVEERLRAVGMGQGQDWRAAADKLEAERRKSKQ